MKLLILTQYFPPETGAPQNRLYELAVRLQRSGVEVTVLTAMPNYPQMRIYEGYRGKKYVYETMEGLQVHRTSIDVSQNRSIVARLRNYFSFVWSSARCSRRLPPRFDLLFCESPPLFLGYSARYLARKKKSKLVFNVSDLWPESAERLGVVTNRMLLLFAYRLEAQLYRRSALVTGQTLGICRNIGARFPEVKTYWLPNGADVAKFDPRGIERGDWRVRNGFSEGDILFLYAGIIGLAQGLEIILDAAAAVRDRANIKFILLGDGPVKNELMQQAAERQLSNVKFLPTVSRQEVPVILKNADAAVVPLKKLEIFKGAIPSKIFEALAMELPLLLGVDGEARELFVDEGRCAIYFPPENVEALAEQVVMLAADASRRAELGRNGRTYVIDKFNRDTIAAQFLETIQKL